MTPKRIRRFRLEWASAPETHWLAEMLDGESRPFGTRDHETSEGRLAVRWGTASRRRKGRLWWT